MHKQYLALNNLQALIRQKTQPTTNNPMKRLQTNQLKRYNNNNNNNNKATKRLLSEARKTLGIVIYCLAMEIQTI